MRVVAVLRARACSARWDLWMCWQGYMERCAQQQEVSIAGSIESRAPQRFVAESRCRTAARGYLTRIAMLPRSVHTARMAEC